MPETSPMPRKPLVHPFPPIQRPFIHQAQHKWLRERGVILPWRSVLVWRDGAIEVWTPGPGRGSVPLVRVELPDIRQAILLDAIREWNDAP